MNTATTTPPRSALIVSNDPEYIAVYRKQAEVRGLRPIVVHNAIEAAAALGLRIYKDSSQPHGEYSLYPVDGSGGYNPAKVAVVIADAGPLRSVITKHMQAHADQLSLIREHAPHCISPKDRFMPSELCGLLAQPDMGGFISAMERLGMRPEFHMPLPPVVLMVPNNTPLDGLPKSDRIVDHVVTRETAMHSWQSRLYTALEKSMEMQPPDSRLDRNEERSRFHKFAGFLQPSGQGAEAGIQ